MMIRREFLRTLATLPFLGFLKGKKKPVGLTMSQLIDAKRKIDDEQDIKDSLESLKFPDGMDFETFSESLNTSTFSGYFIFKGQPMFYNDRLEE